MRKCLDVAKLLNAICEWYSLEGNGTGGPLHIVVDDLNVADRWLDSCREYLLNDTWFDDVRTIEWTVLGLQILNGLRALDENDRRVIINEAHRQLAAKGFSLSVVPKPIKIATSVR